MEVSNIQLVFFLYTNSKSISLGVEIAESISLLEIGEQFVTMLNKSAINSGKFWIVTAEHALIVALLTYFALDQVVCFCLSPPHHLHPSFDVEKNYSLQTPLLSDPSCVGHKRDFFAAKINAQSLLAKHGLNA